MKIRFDYQAFWMQKYGGISRYFYNLCKGLNELEQDVHIIAPLHRNEYIKNLSANLVAGRYFTEFPKYSSLLFRSINSIVCPLALEKSRSDVLHSTYYFDSYKKNRHKQLQRVLTIYDLIHEKFGDQCYNARETVKFKKNAIENSDHIICISEKTKSDLQEFYDVPDEKISVTYLGIDSNITINPSINEMDAISSGQITRGLQYVKKPFLLYVGSRDGYKNFLFLLELLCKSGSFFKDYSLVCFGGGGMKAHEAAILNKYNVDFSRLIFLDGEDSVLAMLYKKADAFVYPSLYEGFGIPPIEAMSLGCPVISSDGGSMPEVLGNGAAYFDPCDSESAIYQILSVLHSKEIRYRLVTEGAAVSRNYTWKKCALETLRIYESLRNSN